jgi:hypothetical protein
MFVIMMILNCIDHVLCGCVMEYAVSVALVGCAASLSKAWTSHRFFNFPRGNKINAQPYNSKHQKLPKHSSIKWKHSLLLLWMKLVWKAGHKHFAWEDHCHREGCKHIIASNADHTWD